MTDIKELVSRAAAETSPAPMAKVFMVSNRTSCVAFATAEQAHKYIASFSASIGGGMSVTSVPVISDPAPQRSAHLMSGLGLATEPAPQQAPGPYQGQLIDGLNSPNATPSAFDADPLVTGEGWAKMPPATPEDQKVYDSIAANYNKGAAQLPEEVREMVTRLCTLAASWEDPTLKIDAADMLERMAARAAKYDELIYAVERKHPGETRHDTALRYIRSTEERANASTASAAATEPAKPDCIEPPLPKEQA